MKRRQALKRTGWILQSAVFTPGLIAALNGCQSKLKQVPDLLVLRPEQFELANAIADTIIPKSETPAASEVRVVEFIDLLLYDVFDQSTVTSFIEGLEAFDGDCKTATGSSFVKLDVQSQIDYLLPLDASIMGENHQDMAPFYVTFKKLCATTYMSTEQGMKQNLDYQPVPGAYHADVELKPGDKIMVGNQM
ncbi:MAG: hypothetical protein DHS20C17_24550 [Cyclobacteriaceae bacterium]|nr:MAG: hypothetical protein DHS20C17_24550 [Cyclobacteriaceae bacterium]